jgi:hypothetical protein
MISVATPEAAIDRVCDLITHDLPNHGYERTDALVLCATNDLRHTLNARLQQLCNAARTGQGYTVRLSKTSQYELRPDDPVMVTVVPPATGPLGGEIAVMLGGATNVNESLFDTALTPPGVVTLTSTGPLPSGGEMAVIIESLTTVTGRAGCEPKKTAVAPESPVPVITTLVPPAVEPVEVESAESRGAGTNEGARSKVATGITP